MARFFGGMGGSGAGSRFNSGKKQTISGAGGSLERAMAAKASQGKKASDMSADERYQALIKEKMDSHKARMMQTKKYSHQLPGTAPMEKELSKSAQVALEIMAQKMAKREMKKKEKPKEFVIKPTMIGGTYGGYLDAKGRVFGAGNKQVLQIDRKTGDIKTLGLFGKKIGKFDPSSNFCFHKIQKQLEKYAIKNGHTATTIWDSPGSSGGSSGGAGSIYGSGNPWGGGNDDKGGSGWW